MKILWSLVLCCLMVMPAFAQSWQEAKGDHFIVYYRNDDRFAQSVLSSAERYYQDIARDLGYDRYSGFWTWDNRVKIYIYANKDEFLKATGQKDWSEGVADYQKKTISSYAWHEGFTDALLPHEIAHLVFRDYVGFKGQVPLWLDEGVAQWMEPLKRKVVRQVVADLMRKGKMISLRDMLYKDFRVSTDAGYVQTFYIQAVSLVAFLVERYGSDNFTAFCRQLRDGKSLEDALGFAYPTSLGNLKQLEQRWLEYIRSTS